MARSLLIQRAEGLGKGPAMKIGKSGWKRAVPLAVALLFISACGGSSAVDADVSAGGGGGGTGISNTAGSPAEMSVGDIMALELGASAVTVDFAGVASGANFILAVGSSSSSGGASSIRLSTNIAAVEDPLAKAMDVESGAGDDDGYGPQEILSAWLRASEDLLPESEIPVSGNLSLSGSKAMGIGKAASVGQQEVFRVLSSLTSVSSYVEVTGKVRCVGSNVVFYVDASSESLISEGQVQTLCSEFDEVAGAETAMLGDIRDPDGDGKLHVLMTKQINCLGALGGGIITGYFYAGDLFERSSSNAVSNYRDIIYTMVPDPDGDACGANSVAISDEFAMSNLLPAVLPHEMQHAISYNQHVFVAGGQPEENWLNEGMSHLIEDVMGYGVENPSRYSMYLASPSTYGVVTQSSPNLMERGAEYLFLRFLYEQSADGDAFLKRLVQSGNRGVEGLEAAFAGSAGFSTFSEFMARWTVALAMSDRGISQDPRYTYKARTKAATGNWEGVLLDGDAQDNRGTMLEGVHLNTYYGAHNPSIDASTSMFYDITTVPNQMSMVGTAGGGNYAVLVRTR